MITEHEIGCPVWCPACRADKFGTTDAGADRDTRERPCTLRTWCVNAAGHKGACVEALRSPYEPADFGPGRIRK